VAADKPLLDQKKFLAQYRFTAQNLEQAKLQWKDLASIHAAHIEDIAELQATADYVSQRLRQLPEVHSLKIRVKDPEHLLAKIVRKKLKEPDREITPETYSEQITDLIGIRAMHLFKEQWAPIHAFVTQTWDLKETPIAYVRVGDPEAILADFRRSGCSVEDHAFGYRSVHYLLTSQPAKAKYTTELQVRTLFEEAWSEIDHQIRYPNLTDDPRLAEFLTIFNRLAGSADEMGTFIKVLREHLVEQAAKVAKAETELNEAISRLKISDAEKSKLQAQVEELRKSSIPSIVGSRYPFDLGNVSALTNVAGLTPISYLTNVPGIGAYPRIGLGGLVALNVCPGCGLPFTKEVGLGVTPSALCPACRKKQGDTAPGG